MHMLKLLKTTNSSSSKNTWMAQMVECPTLDFCSGHDLKLHGIKPCVRLCSYSMETAWDSLPLADLSPLLPMHTLSQYKFKNLKKKRWSKGR